MITLYHIAKLRMTKQKLLVRFLIIFSVCSTVSMHNVTIILVHEERINTIITMFYKVI